MSKENTEPNPESGAPKKVLTPDDFEEMGRSYLAEDPSLAANFLRQSNLPVAEIERLVGGVGSESPESKGPFKTPAEKIEFLRGMAKDSEQKFQETGKKVYSENARSWSKRADELENKGLDQK